MVVRSVWLLPATVACSASLAACGGDGTSATHLAAVPAAAVHQSPAVGRPGSVRRTLSIPTCSGSGTHAFVGGGQSNVADAVDAGVLEGDANEVCDDDSSIAGGTSNGISSGADSATLSFIGSGHGNTITGTSGESGVIAGTGNAIEGNASTSFIGSGTSNTIGTGNQPNSAILAGDSNTISGASGGTSIIGGGYGNLISNAPWSVIGGGVTNTNSAQLSFIGAGQSNAITAAATNAVVVGGVSNSVAGDDAVIGGGSNNSVSGKYGAMAGGEYNAASGKGAYVGGGGYNTASGEGAIVDGGYNDTAAGQFATIPGGYEDSAAGTYSFAAGAYASAPQTGAFVWSDGSNGSTALSSTAAHQFVARASGGVTLWTNAGATVGATLAAGSGTWASLSDRNVKTNIVPLDDDAVLESVAKLPISRWSYRTEHGVRHVGPMAQDFHAAFGVGADDTHITSLDEDGVALAAIKALKRDNDALHRDNAALHRDRTALHAENARLRLRLATSSAAQAAQIAEMQRQIRALTAAMTTLRSP